MRLNPTEEVVELLESTGNAERAVDVVVVLPDVTGLDVEVLLPDVVEEPVLELDVDADVNVFGADDVVLDDVDDDAFVVDFEVVVAALLADVVAFVEDFPVVVLLEVLDEDVVAFVLLLVVDFVVVVDAFLLVVVALPVVVVVFFEVVVEDRVVETTALLLTLAPDEAAFG